jgi:hypothetical protein
MRVGATSHNAIAAKLNERNMKTARGAGHGRMCRAEQSCTPSQSKAQASSQHAALERPRKSRVIGDIL